MQVGPGSSYIFSLSALRADIEKKNHCFENEKQRKKDSYFKCFCPLCCYKSCDKLFILRETNIIFLTCFAWRVSMYLYVLVYVQCLWYIMEEILVPTSSTAAATTGGTLNLSHLRQILLTCSVILAESQDQIFFVLGDSSSSSPAVVLSPAPWQWLPLLSSFLPPRGVIDDDGCSAAVVLNSTRGLEPAQAEALRAPRGSIRRIVMMVATSDPETLSGRMAKSRQVTRMVFLGANRGGFRLLSLCMVGILHSV